MRIKTQSNYLAKVVKLGKPRKHSNADRLQIFTVDFQNIITDLSYKEGDIVVVFPIESQLNPSLVSFFNGFRESELNNDTEQTGFFEKHRRIKAIKLRGEKSGGFALKWEAFQNWVVDQGGPILVPKENTEFDFVGDIEVCKKFEVQKRTQGPKRDKKAVRGFSRLVDGQFRLHVVTDNIRRNIFKFELTDVISISYKLHGTNAVFANLLTKVKRPWYDFWSPKEEYGSIYSSRKVVKNEYESSKKGFYDTDPWGEMNEEIKNKIPKGFTLYGEIVGYQSTGAPIQGEYDYGCLPGEKQFWLFRVTFTNPDGQVIELSTPQVHEFGEKYGFNVPHLFFHGTVGEFLNVTQGPNPSSSGDWRIDFIEEMEEVYNEKDCFMCKHKVPEEGVIIRKENLFSFDVYKLKSFKFLQKESKQLDNESK